MCDSKLVSIYIPNRTYLRDDGQSGNVSHLVNSYNLKVYVIDRSIFIEKLLDIPRDRCVSQVHSKIMMRRMLLLRNVEEEAVHIVLKALDIGIVECVKYYFMLNARNSIPIF